MTEVVVCPRCEGDKKVFNARSGRSEACPTCDGRGVVRVPPEMTEAQHAEDDNLDLTYRR